MLTWIPNIDYDLDDDRNNNFLQHLKPCHMQIFKKNNFDVTVQFLMMVVMMTMIMIVVMMEKMIIGINHIFNNYSNVGSDENCLLLCHNILVVITEIIIQFRLQTFPMLMM